MHFNSGDDFVEVRNLAAGFSSQMVDIPPLAVSLDYLGTGPQSAGVDKVLIDLEDPPYWLTFDGGTWSMAETGIAKWASHTRHTTGGDGNILVQILDPAGNAAKNVVGALRVSNEVEVGKFSERAPGHQSNRATNGRVVVQATRDYGWVSAMVNIYVVPPVQPPGC